MNFILLEKQTMNKYSLVGDVGGTNARLALCSLDSGKISHARTFSGLEFDSLEAVISHYLAEEKQPIEDACIAIACPITGDWVAMTNHTWAFSIEEMKKNLGLKHLEVINDFTAVSMAIPMLGTDDVLQFGGQAALEGKPVAVYGAGTGLGVAHLIPVDKRWLSLPGEGGHVDFAPNSEEEDSILEVLRDELGHVSAERILSGPGLVNLYRAIVKSDHRLPENLAPKDVTERALADTCIDSRRALSLFCVIMGRFGGNLALTMGTFGGVYIAGGIVPRFLDFFRASGFRGAFEDKGRFKDYLQDIPVFLITHDQPGLLGAGAHLRQSLGMTL
jgi:glucokinase